MIYLKKSKFPIWKRLVSFLFPLKIYECDTLELLLYKDNLILNSDNANQSNRELKSAFHKAFLHFKVYKRRYENVLILGMGLGSVISLLQSRCEISSIVAYENNSFVLDVIEKYYETANIEILQSDAIEVLTTTEKYDLIIVDLFQDRKLPSFLDEQFVQNLIEFFLNENGRLILNTLKEHDLLIFDSEKLEVQDNRFYSISKRNNT